MNYCIPKSRGIFSRGKQYTLPACVCVCFFASCTIAIAQDGIQTESGRQTQFFGKWNHPVDAAGTRTLQPSAALDSDQFRKLFPPAQPKPFENHPTVVAGPPAVAQAPPRSRPLQPLPQPMLRGQFREAGFSDSAVASFESTATEPSSANVLPSTAAPNWENQAAEAKEEAAGMMDWISEKSQSALGGVPSQSKDLMSRISGFIGGEDNPIRKVLGALSLVIGSYLGIAWFSRKLNFAGDGRIPSEVIEVLGVSPFGPRKNLQLVRLGSKLLLLMNGPEGTHPVGEITDPAEVEHLASLCKGRSTRPTAGMLSAIRSHTGGGAERRSRSRSVAENSEQSFSTSELMQALENLQGRNSTHSYEA